MHSLFVWNDSYSIGIKSIDEQHQHFFELANGILTFIDGNAVDKEKLRLLISAFGDYAFYHLKTEEDYFKKFAYQMAAHHVAIHDTYRKKIDSFLGDIKKEDVDIKKLADEIAEYSEQWLSGHILEMDRLYAKFFIEHGVR